MCVLYLISFSYIFLFFSLNIYRNPLGRTACNKRVYLVYLGLIACRKHVKMIIPPPLVLQHWSPNSWIYFCCYTQNLLFLIIFIKVIKIIAIKIYKFSSKSKNLGFTAAVQGVWGEIIICACLLHAAKPKWTRLLHSVLREGLR